MERPLEQPQAQALIPALVAGILLLPLGFWARHTGVGPGSVPLLSSSGRSYWLLAVLAVIVTAAVAVRLRFGLPPADGTSPSRASGVSGEQPYSTAWVLPAIASLSGVLLLQVYHSVLSILLVPVAVFGVLVATALLRSRMGALEGARERGLYTLLIHVIAFVALSMVYINKVRSLFSASAVFVLVTLLLIALLEDEPAPFARRLVYALCGGVILGQVTWVLNYWRATGWTGGAALLIFFYLVAGLILTELRGHVSRRDLAEYGVVSAVAFTIVSFALLH